MNIRFIAPGRPGQHLGISHTLKHYLRPEERWDEEAGMVPWDLRPFAFLENHFPNQRPWLNWGCSVTGSEQAKWPELEQLCENGYLRFVRFRLENGRGHEWIGSLKTGQDVLFISLRDGFILEVWQDRNDMRTAYRKIKSGRSTPDSKRLEPKQSHRRNLQADRLVQRRRYQLDEHNATNRWNEEDEE